MRPYNPEEMTMMLEGLINVAKQRAETDSKILKLITAFGERLMALEAKETAREAQINHTK